MKTKYLSINYLKDNLLRILKNLENTLQKKSIINIKFLIKKGDNKRLKKKR